MKKLALVLALVLALAAKAFSQVPDYSVTLDSNESFVKIPRKQIIDSVNLNQIGPEQFEYFEIYLDRKEIITVDNFMENCKSIQRIIDKYGRVEFDVTMGSNSDLIKPLSGFYYSVENVKNLVGYQLTLMVIYPRVDRM
jgi:hypothetical protein